MEIIITVVILAAIAIIAGVLLSVASIVMAVKTDETAAAIEEILPGANCGSCGFSGCSGYAAALSNGDTKETNLCSPGGADVAGKIAGLLGTEGGDFVKKVAVVRCRGNWDVTDMKMEYRGIESCSAANQLFSGLGACQYGCIGFGDCAAVCDKDAITVKNGVAEIDASKCGACTKCVKACPKGIIHIVPEASAASVLCLNRDKGAKTRKVCSAGCIGCMKCTKVCEYGAITVENFLAQIDPKKCVGCGKCAEVCPQSCIKM